MASLIKSAAVGAAKLAVGAAKLAASPITNVGRGLKEDAMRFVPSPTGILKGAGQDLSRLAGSGIKVPKLKSSFSNRSDKTAERVLSSPVKDVAQLKSQVNLLGTSVLKLSLETQAIKEDLQTLSKFQTVLLRENERKFDLIKKQLEKMDKESLEVQQLLQYQNYAKQRTSLLSKLGETKKPEQTNVPSEKNDDSSNLSNILKLLGLGATIGGAGLLLKKAYDDESLRSEISAALRTSKLAAKPIGKAISKKITSETIKKAVEKIAGGALAKFVGKKIPVIGAALGAIFGAVRYIKGDKVGAGLELGSGVSSFVPGAGTAIGAGIDVTLIIRDIFKEVTGRYPLEGDDPEGDKELLARIKDEVTLYLLESHNKETEKAKTENKFTKDPESLTDDPKIKEILKYWQQNPHHAGSKTPNRASPTDLAKAMNLYHKNLNEQEKQSSDSVKEKQPNNSNVLMRIPVHKNEYDNIAGGKVTEQQFVNFMTNKKTATLIKEFLDQNPDNKKNGETEIVDTHVEIKATGKQTIVLDSETILFKQQGIKLTNKGFELASGNVPEWAKRAFSDSYTGQDRNISTPNYKLSQKELPEWAKKAFDESYTTGAKTFGRKSYIPARRGFTDDYMTQKNEENKQNFLAYGKLPRGFEFLPGHMGTLGSPEAVMARGVMPLAGGGGSYSGGGGGGSYSGGGGGGSYSGGGSGGSYSGGGGGGTSTSSSSETASGGSAASSSNDAIEKWIGQRGKSSLSAVQNKQFSGIESGLAKIRTEKFGKEIQNEAVLRQLAALEKVEVGGMSEKSKKDFIETLVNRASVTNSSLMSRLRGVNKPYWGGGIGNPNRVSAAELEAFKKRLKEVIETGRDVTQGATDNASNQRGNPLANRRAAKLKREGRSEQGRWTGGEEGKGEYVYIDTPYAKRSTKFRERASSLSEQTSSMGQKEGELETLPRLSTIPQEFLTGGSSQTPQQQPSAQQTSAPPLAGRSFTKEQLLQANKSRAANIQASVEFVGAPNLGSFNAGTGGRNGESLPYGQFGTSAPTPAGPQLRGRFAPGTRVINVNNMYDPGAKIRGGSGEKGRMRSAIQFHPAIGGMTANGMKKFISAGCIAIDPKQYDNFMKSYSQYYKDNNGKVWVQFLPSAKGQPHKIMITNVPPDPSGIISESAALNNFKDKGDVHPQTAEARKRNSPPPERRVIEQQEKAGTNIIVSGTHSQGDMIKQARESFGNNFTHFSMKDKSSLIEYARKNPNAPIYLFSGGAQASNLQALRDAIGDDKFRQNVHVIEPFTPKGGENHKTIASLIKEGVLDPSKITVGGSSGRGSDLLQYSDQINQNTSGNHLSAPDMVFKRSVGGQAKPVSEGATKLFVSPEELRIKYQGKGQTKVFTGGETGLGQAFGGGLTHRGTTLAAQRFQTMFGDNLTHFSGFNDRFHKGTRSFHAKGLAGDFSIKNGKKEAPEVVRRMTAELESYGLKAGEDFKIIDEYNNPSARATGGHIHYEFRSAAAAKRFQEAIMQRSAEMTPTVAGNAVTPEGSTKPESSTKPEGSGTTTSQRATISEPSNRFMAEAMKGIQQRAVADATKAPEQIDTKAESVEEMMAKYNREKAAQSIFPTENAMIAAQKADPTHMNAMFVAEERFKEEEKRRVEEQERFKETARQNFATEDAVMMEQERIRNAPMPTEDAMIQQQARDNAAKEVPQNQAAVDEAIGDMQNNPPEAKTATKAGGGDTGERSSGSAPSNLSGGNNPESSAPSPGSGGYGSYGRCFV